MSGNADSGSSDATAESPQIVPMTAMDENGVLADPLTIAIAHAFEVEEAQSAATWADVVPGDKVADVSGAFWTVARIDPQRHGMRRVRYVESAKDWHYWTNEQRTVIKCAG